MVCLTGLSDFSVAEYRLLDALAVGPEDTMAYTVLLSVLG
jgi:hypothetical protein